MHIVIVNNDEDIAIAVERLILLFSTDLNETAKGIGAKTFINVMGDGTINIEIAIPTIEATDRTTNPLIVDIHDPIVMPIIKNPRKKAKSSASARLSIIMVFKTVIIAESIIKGFLPSYFAEFISRSFANSIALYNYSTILFICKY